MNCIMFQNDEHYEEICSWWAFYGWPKIEKKALSTFGMVMEHEGQKLCAGWLYMTNSAFYLLEWLVTNPHAPLKIRVQGLEYLIERLVKEGEGFGGKLAFTSVKSRGLTRMLKKRGFQISDTEMTNMVRQCL
jgi:hypothetical protein